MKKYVGAGVFALAVGLVAAYWSVLFFNHWYFAGDLWLKSMLLAPLLALGYGLLLLGSWRVLWLGIGLWWLAVALAAVLKSGSLDLTRLEFVAVLDFEVLFIFVPVLAAVLYGMWRWYTHRAGQLARDRQRYRELKLRGRMRNARTPAAPRDEGHSG